MGSYDEAVAAAAAQVPDITTTRRPGRTKYGFVAGAEQALGAGLGAFARVSANDGANETWAFTEIDRSLAVGVVRQGVPGRDADQLGLAGVVDGLSRPHRRYLAAGGKGFMLGDGALAYRPEAILEAFYRLAITAAVSLALDYQLAADPGYNHDRGPVHLLAARLHAEL
jgi:high affinity Mn2+ porin